MKKIFLFVLFLVIFLGGVEKTRAIGFDLAVGVGFEFPINGTDYLINNLNKLITSSKKATVNINQWTEVKKDVDNVVAGYHSFSASLRYPLFIQLGASFGWWSIGTEVGTALGFTGVTNASKKRAVIIEVPIRLYIDFFDFVQVYTGVNWSGVTGALSLYNFSDWNYDLGIRLHGSNVFPVYLDVKGDINMKHPKNSTFNVGIGFLYPIF